MGFYGAGLNGGDHASFPPIRVIPRDPTVAGSAIFLCRDVDEIFVVYSNHLVLDDVCRVSAPCPWSKVYDYNQ